MIRKQVLTRILRSERESAARRDSAKFKSRPVRVKNAAKDAFFDVVELQFSPRRFLRLQMLRFCLLRIDDRLGPRSAAVGSSCILRARAQRTRNAAGDEKHGELSDNSNSHGYSFLRIKRSRRFRAPCLSIWSLQLQPNPSLFSCRRHSHCVRGCDISTKTRTSTAPAAAGQVWPAVLDSKTREGPECRRRTNPQAAHR